MQQVMMLKNIIQPYAWGAPDAMARLLRQPHPSGQPQAEMWLGTHPRGPSQVWYQEQWQPLGQLIHQDPIAMLGPERAKRFGPQLPFLFKLLAVHKPLSLQVHPDQQQAQQGYAREDRQGIAWDAPQRNYRDCQSKPEIICALTPFWALAGFRPPSTVVDLFQRVGRADLVGEYDPDNATQFWQDFLPALLTLPASQKQQIVASVTRHGERLPPVLGHWVQQLAQQYPGDIGVLAPLWLQLLHLQPYQAVYLPPRQLHAYLQGMGIELMTNSDNVLRAGLTPKHIAIEELLQVLDFTTSQPQILQPGTQVEHVYPTPVHEFQLSLIRLQPGEVFHSSPGRGIELMICTAGRATIETSASSTAILQGQTWVVPAALTGYRIKGQAVIFKATVPVAPA